MLSMAIFTFESRRFTEVIERRRQEKATVRGKTHILGEWCDRQNGRVFRLIEDGDLKDVLAAYRTWSDLETLEIFPVMETKELIDQ